MVGVEQWAEVRRMKRVEGLSAREIGRRTGLARDTVSRLLAAEEPPRYSRAPAGSILDPFKDWVCQQLQADPKVPSQRLRELAVDIGYAGGKTIFDAYVREVRPRFLVKRTFQRTIYRPAELIQCDLWEPSEHVPVPSTPGSSRAPRQSSTPRIRASSSSSVSAAANDTTSTSSGVPCPSTTL